MAMLAEEIDEAALPKVNAVQGCLGCSTLLLTLAVVAPQLVPVLLPCLLRILSSPSYATVPGVHRRAISTLHGVFTHLGHIQGSFQRKVGVGCSPAPSIHS
jgi:hypothetical protein